MLDVVMTGSGGTMPLPSRFLASAVLRCEGRSLLIDCGEGTQVAIRKSGFTMKPIDTVLITHMHGDHISGLPGLLLSMGNEERTEPVTIIGPKGLERTVRSLLVIAPELPFELNILEVGGDEELQAGPYIIKTIQLKHTKPTLGYSIEIKRLGKFDRDKAEETGLPRNLWSFLQKGQPVEYEGRTFDPSCVMGAERRGLKFCYCTDTRPDTRIAEFGKDSDLMILEGMFGDDEKLERALKTQHMMMSEAACIARDAGAAGMWFTHYSPSLPDPENYIESMREIFPAAELGEDGKKITLRFRD